MTTDVERYGGAHTMTPEQAAALRKPFPKSAIGKLPKAGMQLDYVGHAAVVDRLLAVDPNWSWEPFATDERGLPALDTKGNLWIRMTVCGVTRIGVGDGPNAKQIISDALRNAAMRFGVALDLWSKEELESTHGPTPGYDPGVVEANTKAFEDEATAAWKAVDQESLPVEDPPQDPITDDQIKKLHTLAGKLGLDRDGKLAGIAATIGREVTSSKDLSKDEATKVIKAMQTGVKRREELAKETAE